MRNVGRAGVDNRPLDEAGVDQFLDRTEALRRRERHGCIGAACKRNGRVADHIDTGPDPLDDGSVDLIVVALPPAHRVVRVEMKD